MRHRSTAASILLAFLVVLYALYLPRLAWPDAWLYRVVVTPAVLKRVGSLAQTAPLVVGAVYALRAARTLESGNRARPAWWLLGGWLSSFGIGEIIISVYSSVLGVEVPSPSAGDAFFVAQHDGKLLTLVHHLGTERGDLAGVARELHQAADHRLPHGKVFP